LAPVEEEKLLHKEEAQLYAQFCFEAIQRLDAAQSRTTAWKRITTDYNAGRIVPELRELKGPRKERALREWIKTYYESNFNMFALIHKSKSTRKERKITFHEQQYLLNKLLSPNRIKIGSAIVNMKQMARQGFLDSPTHERTLRRWCEEWAETHPAEWYQAREGSKYVSERVIKSIRRDDSSLAVGEVWVADGHTLSFDIINPQTGRAQRMTMIMVMDWASRYPVGASLAFTEDSQHILTAFRNGFINASQIADNDRQTMAVLPQYVYLDNGKAFRSKLFHEQWEDHDLNKELGGIFPRLDIGVRFAESYNAKAKIIERFFKTFQEQFERFISTFRGASVADKPAHYGRNEKWAKKLYTGKPPTIEETMQMINFYVRKCYGETPHGSLQHRTPYEVFSAARIAENRQIEISRLNFMMMAMERKNIRNEGIRLNKLLYWDRKLVDHVGQPCIIRYDYSDARWIVVYDKNDTFICQAALRQTQHPFIEVSMDKAVSHKALNKEYNEIKKLRRDKERSAQKWVMSAQESVDVLLRQHAKRPAVTDELEDAESLFNSPPMLEAPPPDPDEIIEEMTRQAMRNMPLHPSMLDNRANTENQDDETEQETPYEAKRRKDEEIRTVLERMGFDRREFRGEIPQFFIDMANNHIRKQQAEQNKAQANIQTKPDKATSEQNKQPGQDDTDKSLHTLDEIDIELMRSEGIPIPGEDEDDEDGSNQKPIEYLDKETLRRIGIFK
ncbi:MAG: Mu transposase C-terminal domain-containing protein, partial [Synergistaceae bacterium]|nr:Mu transposase C-terminal domain-containing protein [Synergistaceae bacterium]